MYRSEVYPRECGGTSLTPLRPPGPPGLSPRVRGNPVAVVGDDGGHRSIPASAGEPRAGGVGRGGLAVYPRECGGTLRSRRSQWGEGGLSPRVRGNPALMGGTMVSLGSIPASAGEPPVSGVQDTFSKVYPRECGGTGDISLTLGKERGLSPRVRGNRPQPQLVSGGDGSIPASAGEPHQPGCFRRGRGVYPRECGGTHWVIDAPDGREGLSPRVRGNLRCPPCRDAAERSIPASAGEPTTYAAGTTGSGVYPRECGGTELDPEGDGHKGGLSPRVRGNRRRLASRISRIGSIPASAGEPWLNRNMQIPVSVYPRECGGNQRQDW